MIAIAEQLSSSKGERGEAANIALAHKIAAASDAGSVKELIRLVETGKTAVQNDAIKVLYEIGAEKPKLIASHAAAFTAILGTQNNRLQWGAMTALDAITSVKPDEIAKHLQKILAAAKTGSVITKDHAVGILVKLAGTKKHAAKALPALTQQLKTSADNQFPMYAELSLTAFTGKMRTQFVQILNTRMKKLPKASQQKRIEKLLRKLT